MAKHYLTDRKFDFWQYDKKTDSFIYSIFYHVKWITNNGCLCIEDPWGRTFYVKPEYFEQTTSPMWQQTTNKPFYIIRERFELDEQTINETVKPIIKRLELIHYLCNN